MRISKLIQSIANQSIQRRLVEDAEILSITTDSRRATKDFLFVAVRGTQNDGHDFITKVLEAGCKNLVIDSESKLFDQIPNTINVFEVTHCKVALNHLSNRFYDDPAEKLAIVGVTGTNGKTTVTHMIEVVMNFFKQWTGVMGTIDHHLKSKVWESLLTTPDTIEFYSRLQDFITLSGKVAAIEVSSHALQQKRVDDVPFDIAIFTNLTRDHLDYHGTMEEYFLSKEILFKKLLAESTKKKKLAILNADDPSSWRLSIPEDIEVIFYKEIKEGAASKAGLNNFELPTLKSNQQVLFYQILSSDFSGLTIEVTFRDQSFHFRLPMIGKHNAANACCALLTAYGLGYSVELAGQALENFAGVRGRLEKVKIVQDSTLTSQKSLLKHIFVDYAHTDQALETVLSALIEIRKGASLKNKIWTVFGCGGDRDTGKRPLMGEVATRMSDQVIITSDNPRNEDPKKIIDQIVEGCTLRSNYQIEVDRRRAIHMALNQSGPGDVILIAGKGHEDYQIIGTVKHHFDDVEEVKEYFRCSGK